MNKTNIIILIAFALVLTACSTTEPKNVQASNNTTTNNNNNNNHTQIANPASKYCIDNNGTLDIRTMTDGSQAGYCVFSNNLECEEWSYMRGECVPKHICTATEKQADICTMDYNPVCGNDNVTYGNGCGACSAKVNSWTRGECI